MSSSVSYASGPSDKPLLGTPIPKLFDRIVEQYGDREAVVSIHQDVRLTYSQLAERANELARAFIAAGFEKGDRVGVWSPNNVEWLTTQYATAKAGIILVTINPAYRVHELAYVLEQSGCKGLVLQNQFKTSDYEAMISELCPDLRSVETGSLSTEKFPNLNTVVSMTASEVAGIYDWSEFLGLAKNCDDEVLSAKQLEKKSLKVFTN